jgi:hypothetical protein
VLPRSKETEITYAKNQKPYLPLPAIRDENGLVTTRWRLSWIDRFKALIRGDIYLRVMTFNNKLQPVKVMVDRPDVSQAVYMDVYLLSESLPVSAPRSERLTPRQRMANFKNVFVEAYYRGRGKDEG